MDKYVKSMYEFLKNEDALEANLHGGFLWIISNRSENKGVYRADFESRSKAFGEGKCPDHKERTKAIYQYMTPKLRGTDYLLESYEVRNGEEISTHFHLTNIYDI